MPKIDTVRAPIALPSKFILLDLTERVIVVSLFGHFAYGVIRQYTGAPNIITALLFAAEFIPFVLIVLRASSRSLSQNPLDWLFGIAGTAFPLLISPTVAVEPLIPRAICLTLVLVGMCVQISAKIVLGSSFGIIAANRGIKILGPYRVIRHPMYAGYTLTHIGLWLAMPSLRNAILYGCALALQIVRIRREERVLNLDPAYRNFASQVRYRLLPGLF
ncbi:MAG TPA: isoprenylcysteine carboxylmethyltransferase family protein [Nitrobacter sp.]|jgi:protein-S-isoprenylcysteine O-methyltransferase Ste14|nr:isoprenylcysteine carboxylmethyltransferase family protein [Nitrobacter sp.]